jgi:cytochrome P450
VSTPVTPDPVPAPSHVPRERLTDFDVYDPPREGQDYGCAWQTLQDALPDLVWTTTNDGHWIAMRGPMIREILEDYEHFSSQVIMVPRSRGEIDLLPTAVDPPRHRFYRALLNTGLAPGAVRQMEDAIRAYTVRLVEQIQPRGRCDFVADFAQDLPIAVFFQLADLPRDDQAMLGGWMEQVMRPDGSMSQEDAMGQFTAYLSPYIAERRLRPGPDMISTIVSSEIDGRPITDADAIQMCTALVLGGLDTVIAFMSFTMHYLAGSPVARRFILENPGKIDDVVEELCRRFPVGTNARLVTSDLLFHGVQLKAGDLISMPQILHSLDEQVYERPLEVDFARNPAGYCTFGHGPHRCPGAFLAKAEVRILLQEWLPRIPDFELEPDARIHVSTGVTAGIFRLPLRWA